MTEKVTIGNATLYLDDCLEVLRTMPDCSVDSIVTDPPYGLGKEPDALAMLTDWLATGHHDVKGTGFMGKAWDAFVPQPALWRECLRVLKPGGHLLTFAGTRTHDLMTLGLRIAGFEIRDTIMWVYGSGFPKSLDVSKAIDKMGGEAVPPEFAGWLRTERQRQGLTAKELCERGGFYKNVNHGGLVSNWEAGIGTPNAAQFNLLCDLLDLPLSRREEVEREVLGWRKVAPGVAFSSEGAPHVAVTAPATDAARQWEGWGTALKPALEPITVARKPLVGTVAANVLAHGTGALNIDGCRVGDFQNTTPSGVDRRNAKLAEMGYRPGEYQMGAKVPDTPPGRWPANLIHDGSVEVLALFPESSTTGKRSAASRAATVEGTAWLADNHQSTEYTDTGSAARFFYCAKASKKDREEGLDHMPAVHRPNGNKRTDQDYRVASGERPPNAESGPRRNTHPTVKPTDLMRYLCRLVTPPGGTVLDPFTGSGSTGKAARLEGFAFIGIERESNYFDIAYRRIEDAQHRGG